MKEGERATGIPSNPRTRREHPTVTGYYSFAEWEFLGERHVTEFVDVGDASVDCDEIRPARDDEPDTVF